MDQKHRSENRAGALNTQGEKGMEDVQNLSAKSHNCLAGHQDALTPIAHQGI